MAMTQEDAVKRARADLAQRLGIGENEITEEGVEASDFPDASLGAPVEDEMSADMITPGWRIRLRAQNASYEYRADRRQLRLADFQGENYLVS